MLFIKKQCFESSLVIEKSHFFRRKPGYVLCKSKFQPQNVTKRFLNERRNSLRQDPHLIAIIAAVSCSHDLTQTSQLPVWTSRV
jgi:hypothetical protein